MRPAISVSLEPGLERGVPWGRDLYTFVTSAAGHMMRTLQKPRKNRPSKRQVNHRRFLHNMIQRKFADIEAANHRLASVLYFKEKDKSMSSLSSQKSNSPDQSGNPSEDADKCNLHTDKDGTSKSRNNTTTDLYETEASEKRKQSDSRHLWKHHPKSQTSTCTTAMNIQRKRRQKKESRIHKLVEFKSISSPKSLDLYHGAEPFYSEYYSNENQSKAVNNLSEDTETPLNDFIQFAPNVEISSSFSPELSLLSLDSCDFSIQMFTDLSTCTQAQKNMSDFPESQLTDIMELFTVGDKDQGDYTDIEAYFENIFECQGDDVTFADQSVNFTEVDDLYCEEGEYKYEYAYANQGVTSNPFQSNQRSSPMLRQSAYTAEEQFNTFELSQSTDISQSQFPSSIGYHYNITQLQMYQCSQEERPCTQITCANNLPFTPFEGVAQSFSAPLNNPDHRSIPTPPQEDDWLFTDILKDRKSSDY